MQARKEWYQDQERLLLHHKRPYDLSEFDSHR